jgi:multicomponent Na+:H+ antiporter subunit C
MSEALGIYNYWIYIILMMIGFYGVIAKMNLIKQAIALGLFQTGIFLFYISMAVVDGGTAPIWTTVGDGSEKFLGPYDNPLPHVLILTAIVVSVSVLAVALAIIINIKRSYGTIEADEIEAIEHTEGADV